MKTKYRWSVGISTLLLCGAYSLNGMAQNTTVPMTNINAASLPVTSSGMTVIITNTSQIAVPVTAWGWNSENTWPPCSPNELGTVGPGQTATYQIEQCATVSSYPAVTISIVGQTSTQLMKKYMCGAHCYTDAFPGSTTKLHIIPITHGGVQIVGP